MTGLCLGKYAPFHLGHKHILDTAAIECDNVLVMVYDCPEIIDIPASVRADWIRRKYAFRNFHVLECYRSPKETGYSKRAMKAQEEYILHCLGNNKIHRFYSAEKYGEHVSKALGAKDRRLSKIHNISATMIRSNLFECKYMVLPEVYRDFIANIVFLGGPSTGKTTIAEKMAGIFSTSWMPEYGRGYWEQHQCARILTPGQLVDIAYYHVQHENNHMLSCNKYLFTDTNAITTLLFHKYYHGSDFRPSDAMISLADECSSRYDIVFLCEPDFPMDDTWDRSGDAQRDIMQQWHREELIKRKIPFYTLSGTVAQRARKVEAVLKKFKKWSPIKL